MSIALSRFVLLLLALVLLAVFVPFGRLTLGLVVVLGPMLAIAGLVGRIAEGRAVFDARPEPDDPNPGSV